MTQHADDLRREALDLSPVERAGLAAELLASLDEPPTDDPAVVSESWAREIERRSRRAMAGDTPGVPWDQVRDRIDRRLAGR